MLIDRETSCECHFWCMDRSRSFMQLCERYDHCSVLSASSPRSPARSGRRSTTRLFWARGQPTMHFIADGRQPPRARGPMRAVSVARGCALPLAGGEGHARKDSHSRRIVESPTNTHLRDALPAANASSDRRQLSLRPQCPPAPPHCHAPAVVQAIGLGVPAPGGENAL